MPAYFAYYQVSTQKQGNSGLGLEAQQAAVVSFLKGDLPQADYVEVESGKKNQRPQLLAAMAAARAAGATLLITKLDRLSRNASFILTLRDSGVNFVCCDMPRQQSQQNSGLRQTAAFTASRRAQGVSFRQLAVELNAFGFTAPRGGTFNQKQVQRLYERVVGGATAAATT